MLVGLVSLEASPLSLGFPDSSAGKKSTCNAMKETPVQFLGQEEPLEKGQATHSIILGLLL